ncbi:hypothetical protein CR513_30631, partial [Mucuna pruriens]
MQGDQKMTRQCYIESLNDKNVNHVEFLGNIELDPRFIDEPEPIDDYRHVGIDLNFLCHKLVIFPKSRPIAQRKRQLRGEKKKIAIEKEIAKFWI